MDSHKLRTYGKRAGMKRKQETCSPLPARTATPTADDTALPIKRRKLVSPRTTRMQSPSPSPDEVLSVIKKQESHLPAIQQDRIKSSDGRRVVMNGSTPHSPSKAAKLTQELSGIFDAMLSPSSSASPTKLAKRMLARSKTESSIESQSTAPEKVELFERTPSLPTLPPSPSKQRDPPSRSNSSTSLLPILPPTSKSTTRTYAGKFRSFLVTLPSSNSQTLDAEEEFETRESYSSLRSRWDVDNSEDDPYPSVLSPPTKSPSKSKSNSATPDMSPYRSGKGKSKGSGSAVRLTPIPYGMSNPLKSISELRNKGESRRFLDELGYLFEGMDGQGALGLRRASALEITTKLCDADFARKAKAADFYTRAWDLFLEAGAGKGDDKILDILLIFFVALVARDPASLAELTQRSISPPPSPSIPSKIKTEPKRAPETSFFAALFGILAYNPPSADPLVLAASQASASDADLKKAAISKKDRPLLSSIYNTITGKANLFTEVTPISTSLLISFSLQALPPHSIPINYFPAFLASLRLSLLSSTSTTLAASLSSRWLSTAKAIPYQNIYHHLRLLDAYLLDQWDAHSDGSTLSPLTDEEYSQRNDEEMAKAREEWLTDDLGALGVCIELRKREDSDSFPARKYLETTLRVLVSLTHTDALWGRKVVQGGYTLGCVLRTLVAAGRAMQATPMVKEVGVKEESVTEGLPEGADEDGASRDGDVQALDTLCLALGLLTNLVQGVEEAKDVLREIRLAPSCPLRKHECGRKCACTARVSGVQILADLYAAQQARLDASSTTAPLAADSPEAHAEADASFLRGHLAVLFGLLMMGSAENERAVLAALPTPFPRKAASVDEKKAKAVKRTQFARLVEQAKDFAAFYTAVSGDIGGERESRVAGDVVRFLEAKRDAVFL